MKKKEIITSLQKKRIDGNKNFIISLLNNNSNIPNFRVSTKKTLLKRFHNEINYLPSTLNILPTDCSIIDQKNNIILAKIKNNFYFKEQFKQSSYTNVTIKVYNNLSFFKKFYNICKKVSLTKKSI